MPVGEYLQSLLSGQVAVRGAKSNLPPEEWIRRFEAWVASHSEIKVVLQDAAMEREAIYVLGSGHSTGRGKRPRDEPSGDGG